MESGQKLKSNGINIHAILMVLCCLIPILLIIALRVIGIQNSWLSFASVLVCPLAMVMMMVFMRNKGSDSHEHTH